MRLEDLPIATLRGRRAVELADNNFLVHDREDRTLGPTGELERGIFRWAEVKSSHDLSALGLIPERLNKDRLIEAVREDALVNAAMLAEHPSWMPAL